MVASFISTKRTGGPKVQKRSGTIIAIEEESDIPCNVRRQKTGQRATLYILVKVSFYSHFTANLIAQALFLAEFLPVFS